MEKNNEKTMKLYENIKNYMKLYENYMKKI